MELTEMTNLLVHTPVDAPGEPAPFVLAPRRELPERARVCLIDNGKPGARVLLGRIAAEIPGVRVEVVGKPTSAATIDEADALSLARRADVVVAGVGDCGACSLGTLHDAVTMERAGVAAAAVITEPFQAHVASYAAKLGAPGYQATFAPHPIWTLDDDAVSELARRLAVAVVALVAPTDGTGGLPATGADFLASGAGMRP
jgi:hypothetical protein